MGGKHRKDQHDERDGEPSVSARPRISGAAADAGQSPHDEGGQGFWGSQHAAAFDMGYHKKIRQLWVVQLLVLHEPRQTVQWPPGRA